MAVLRDFFAGHLDFLYMCYIIAFVAMGAGILAFPRRDSAFKFTRVMGLLIGFAFAHGIHELMQLQILLRPQSTSLVYIALAALAVTNVYLCEFGRNLI
ncbi:MAG: hypothetical protein KKH34_09570, partial [Candidatus Omnitrophica bacterium]|nr:hypothetical protein [Candidatus Omnitrophota bacterium]